jgi:prophage antirepressor-like protein
MSSHRSNFRQEDHPVGMSQLVKRSFEWVDVKCECWIFISIDERGEKWFWFKGHDVAIFLGYANPADAVFKRVKPKWKKTWEQLKGSAGCRTLDLPTNWQPHSVFISEPGLYSLIAGSKMPEAEQFMDWVFEDVLTSLRRDGQYKLEKKLQELTDELIAANTALRTSNTALITANENLDLARRDTEQARRDIIALSKTLVNVAQDVVAKPKSPRLLHVLAVHEHDDDIIFTRCQLRSLNRTLKKLKRKYLKAKELHREKYVPNGVNVLNCVKDRLREAKVPYVARHNVVRVSNRPERLVSLVKDIVKKNKIQSFF